MRGVLSFAWRWAGLLALACLPGCEGQQPAATMGPQYQEVAQGPTGVYRFAIHPLHNPSTLVAAYQPLMDYLGSHVDNAKFVVEASRDYQAYEVKFRERAPHFLLPNPWQTLEAIKVGYRVIAMAGKADDFKGIFIARKDRAIRQPDQLRGGKVSYPSPTALAACMMPQWYLHTHGIDINRDVQNFYVGSQESSIMNAYIGEVLVGATWPPPWRLFQQQRPDEAAQLEVVWETEPLLNNSVMVRDDVPPAVADQVREWLLKLADQPQGGTILQGMQTEGFYLADDRSYQPVREFIATFEAEIRPVESL